ncbi:MAG: hypothetical protein ABJO02_04945 [Reichenbachiella sp.]|uniref:hypothetical protein n=1 Tax=Reichenbachiella sp. TaxID=2184521 RepID=UPI003297EB18
MTTFTFLLMFNFVNPDGTDSLRSQYLQAAVDKSKIESFKSTCSQTKLKHPTHLGYCTMIHFLEAKNALNPYRKLSEFNIGKKTLDSLIKTNTENIELRYLRHSIQDRVPSVLGYNDQLENDKEFMSIKLNSISDSSTYQLIYNYLSSENK